MKHTLCTLLLLALSTLRAQDTFSIVAVDSVTGEVGSAGASCVDLFSFPGFSNDFLGVLFPGLGAINTQAFFLPSNQDNATARMNLGETPAQIIQWLIANDAQGQPHIRQYGIAALVNGSPQAAAHTGTATNDYKGQRVGSNYAIQGNILLGPEILDSMEARFLNTEGDLACKLMAAMQGANVVGADTRCAPFGNSSLFAFLKVAQPSDAFGAPSLLLSVRTSGFQRIEPIDSLQSLFDRIYLPQSTDSLAACDSLTWINGETYTASTDVTFRIVGGAANGCDSLVTLALTIPEAIDRSLTIDSLALTIQANQQDARYQWLDCGAGFVPIAGATNQTLASSEGGQFAVAITVDGCTDTSDCAILSAVGLPRAPDARFSVNVFPNPTRGTSMVQWSETASVAVIRVKDLRGRTLQTLRAQGTQSIQLRLDQPAGFYWLEVETPRGRQCVPLSKW